MSNKAVVIFMGYKYTFKNYDDMCKAVGWDQPLTVPIHKQRMAEKIERVDDSAEEHF